MIKGSSSSVTKGTTEPEPLTAHSTVVTAVLEKCVHHDETIKFYCDSCSVLACPSCILSNCTQHQYNLIDEKAKEHKAMLNVQLLKVKDLSGILENHMDKIKKTENDLIQQRDDALSALWSAFRCFQDLLSGREKDYAAKLQLVVEDQIKEMRKKNEPIMALLEQFNKTITYTDAIITNSTSIDLLCSKVNLSMEIESLLINSDFISSLPSPTQYKLSTFIPSESLLAQMLPTTAGVIKTSSSTALSGTGIKSPQLHHINYIYFHTPTEVSESRGITVEIRCIGKEVLDVMPKEEEFMPVLVDMVSSSYYQIVYKPILRGRYKVTVHEDEVELISSYCINVPILPTHITDPVRIFSGMKRCWAIATSSCSCSYYEEIGSRQPLAFIGNKSNISICYRGGKWFEEFYTTLISNVLVSGLCEAADGSIYRAISTKDKITKHAKSGEIVCSVTKLSNEETLNNPYGLAIFRDFLYVCDSNSHCIRIFDLNLQYIDTIGHYGKGETQFSCCIDIAFDVQTERMYVVESGNKRIQVLDLNGTFIQFIGVQNEYSVLEDPRGISIYRGYIYVTDKASSQVFVFSLDGQLITSIGKGYLKSPCGVDVDLDGFVWICDQEKEAVLIF